MLTIEGTAAPDVCEQKHPADLAISPDESATAWENNLFGLTIFMGAFLLFQVQLIMGRYILPWFGGTPAVWTACLLVFQVLLLGGYAYAHGISQRFSPQAQCRLHASVVFLSLVLMVCLARAWKSPITPGVDWKPQAEGHPTWDIVRFLLAGIGLPFLVLSTTGPLLQRWFVRMNRGESPYRLYALSNLGSLLGLVAYPFLFEPNLTLHAQAWVWSGSYAVYSMGYLICAFWVARRGHYDAKTAEATLTTRPSRAAMFLWVGLAACASVMLLATTNVICQQVAVVPFLWVLPLCLYLISFILCFESNRWYRREIFHPLYLLTAGGTCALLLRGPDAPLFPQLVIDSMLLFVCCMVCHGEVVRLKPNAAHLTIFYLLIAAGGALGGIFVSLVAPHVFPNFWEFPIGILGTGVLLMLATRRDRQSWWARSPRWAFWGIVSGAVLLVGRVLHSSGLKPLDLPVALVWSMAALTAVVALVSAVWSRRRGPSGIGTRIAAASALLILAVGFLVDIRIKSEDVLARARNFYGVIAVLRAQSPQGPFLFLRDRMTNHGMQFLDPKLANETWEYYGPSTGIGILLRNYPRPMRVGVVGLGTGTLAAFGRTGDFFRFYEINPAVVKVSYGRDAYFTYLRNTKSTAEVVLGDARLSLEREAERGDLQRFDVLVLDAFSGDAIPTHLLTREAFEIYLKHLRSRDSLIAVHISNQALDLSPIVGGIARQFHFTAMRIYRPWLRSFSAQTDWVLLSQNPDSLANPEIEAAGRGVPVDNETPLWTDDYTNLLRTLKF